MRCLLFLVCLAGASASEAADCSAAESESRSLREQLQAAQAEIQGLRQRLQQAQEFSVMDVVVKSGSIAGDVFTHLLDQTDIDEHIVSATARSMGTAQEVTATATASASKMAEKLSQINYNDAVSTLTTNELYLTHVAPHANALHAVAQPYVEQYVQPSFENAKVHMAPAYTSAVDAVNTHLPTIRKSSTEAFSQVSGVISDAPRHMGFVKVHLNKVLDPVFSVIDKASPAHAAALPKHPVDRLLLLALVAVVAFTLLKLASRSLRITLKLSLFTTKLVRFVMRIPLFVTFKALAWTFWVATGFYVCGLCKRRKAVVKASEKAKGAKDGEQDKGQATVAELQSLLQKSQQKGKLADGVKSLVSNAKTGKLLTFPKEVEGKHVTKDVLKKALSKFKEVDVKKLGL